MSTGLGRMGDLRMPRRRIKERTVSGAPELDRVQEPQQSIQIGPPLLPAAWSPITDIAA